MARFGRVLTAMITPFTPEGALDRAGAAELAKWLIAQGNDGLVVAGTTGESPTLSTSEHLDLIQIVREAVPEAVVVAGVGSNDTNYVTTMIKDVNDMGVDGYLTVTPYYNRPSQAGIAAHFAAQAEATDLPLMLYDIPARSGRKIDTATILSLASQHPNIVALKDAAGAPGVTAHLLAEAPDGFEVYSGDDSLTLPLLAVGATGVVGVATHWLASTMREMIEAFLGGNVKLARQLNAAMIPSFNFEASELAPNPVPTKAVLRALGQPSGFCRLPMGPEPEGLASQAQALLASLQ